MSGDAYHVRAPRGNEIPLLVSIPHTGTEVPDDIATRFASDDVRALPDTDWHLHELYDFVPELGATTVFARMSRYVVDLNRPRDRSSLYPGRSETSIVPRTTFADVPIWRAGAEPDDAEIEQRIERWWVPYHRHLQHELERLRERFGYALLFDAHSITSHVPRFWPGELPILMLGDVDGTSAARAISARVLEVHALSGLSWQANRPFKGGWITRCFGRPADGVHALQLEMSQRAYMDEGPPFRWREDLARGLRPVLRDTLEAFAEAGAALARR